MMRGGLGVQFAGQGPKILLLALERLECVLEPLDLLASGAQAPGEQYDFAAEFGLSAVDLGQLSLDGGRVDAGRASLVNALGLGGGDAGGGPDRLDGERRGGVGSSC